MPSLVDATYRSELCEQNEINFARFDAKLEQRLAEFRTQFGAEVRSEMAAGFKRVDERFERVDARLASLEQTITDARADLIKWSFVFWVGAVAAIALLAGVLDR